MELIEEILTTHDEVERKKDKAATVLEDEIGFIMKELEKAQVILQEVQENYFHNYTPGKDSMQILYDFEKNQKLAEIVSDYLHEATVLTEALQERIN